MLFDPCLTNVLSNGLNGAIPLATGLCDGRDVAEFHVGKDGTQNVVVEENIDDSVIDKTFVHGGLGKSSNGRRHLEEIQKSVVLN
jgi:hypothetical protein